MIDIRTSEQLDPDAIRAQLTAKTVGTELHVVAETDSTNALLKGLAAYGAPEGTVVIADAQTCGRGRHGAPWFSPPGVNLYASVLFRPRLEARDATLFSFIASIAVTDAVNDLGAMAGIKWPNDVLVGRKKVAGTLVTCGARGADLEYVILGVGVNLNVDVAALHTALGSAGRFATSVAAATGVQVDRNAFAASYLNRLDTWARVFATRGSHAIVAAWREREILGGRRVEVRGDTTTIEGRVRGIDRLGALIVVDGLGKSHLVTSEQVRILE
jgi:BirA family transcriptional regulator, biotin operon repressor / biotin---[acetyl-CoA-carboxylase] ligase